MAALVLFGGACALPLGEVKATASVSSLGILMVFIGVQFALIKLRRAQPGARRPFRVPLSIGRLPLLGIVACAVLLTRLPMHAWLIVTGILGRPARAALAAEALADAVRGSQISCITSPTFTSVTGIAAVERVVEPRERANPR